MKHTFFCSAVLLAVSATAAGHDQGAPSDEELAANQQPPVDMATLYAEHAEFISAQQESIETGDNSRLDAIVQEESLDFYPTLAPDGTTTKTFSLNPHYVSGSASMCMFPNSLGIKIVTDAARNNAWRSCNVPWRDYPIQTLSVNRFRTRSCPESTSDSFSNIGTLVTVSVRAACLL